MTEFKSAEQLENNFSIFLTKESCKLGIGWDWFNLNKGTDYGDRISYSWTDERGVNYGIFYYHQKREFGDLFVEDSSYRGMGRKKFTIPRDRQFINIGW